ncbi:MAG: hypothetical protein R3B09_02400 [Nannocystaceae bacterium]
MDLVRDLETAEGLDGYILTAQGVELAARITWGLTPKSTERAWTLTGPYGVGKSAFALFLATLLGPKQLTTRRLALRALGHGDLPKSARELATQVRGASGLFVIPLGATRESLPRALADATATAIRRRFNAAKKPWRGLCDELSLLTDRRKKSKAAESEYLKILERIQDAVAAEGLDGILVIVDELGKFLEHAATNPADDAFILQRLAEHASRSTPHVFCILTILHQAFERYAAMLPQTARNEWQKIQGRFQDVAFIEQSSEVLHLVGSALEVRGRWPKHVADEHQLLIDKGREAGIICDGDQGLFHRMLPLHPVTAAVLPGLFRSALAQNERSLFSFLTSPHRHGFTEFLRESHAEDIALFRVDALFDYVTETLGPALLASTESKRWSEILSAVERTPTDAPSLAPRIVKAIGLLSLFAPAHAQATPECLAYAFGDRKTPTGDVQAALESLTRASIVVFRRHRGAFGLWEGSDIDLDAHFTQVRRPSSAVADLLTTIRERVQLHPAPARGHFFRTGTLRFFEVEVVMLGELLRTATTPPADGDGRILYLLPSPEITSKQLIDRSRKVSRDAPCVVIAVPKNAAAILDAAADLDGWIRVRQATAALAGDTVARRELAARISAAEQRLDAALTDAFGWGDRMSTTSATWIYAGDVLGRVTPRDLARKLSEIFDTVFSEAPIIRNELLNRRQLSSAAAAARRDLVERILQHAGEEDLGITGFPPESSMYASLLKKSGLHRERDGRWSFGSPPVEDPLRFGPIWNRLECFFDETEAAPKSIAELRSVLSAAPYGVKDGPFLVLLFAAMVASSGEVALFEENTFHPDVSSALAERMLRRPESFSIARYRLDDGRLAVLQALGQVLGLSGAGASHPIEVLRAIVRRRNALPKFTLTTRRIDSRAVSVRATLNTATHPMQLLFTELPKALGLPPIERGITGDDAASRAGEYAALLAESLQALDGAYAGLLESVRRSLADALDLSFEATPLRSELVERAKRIQTLATDPRLRSFIIRSLDTELPDREWLESLTTIVIVPQRPPSEWTDGELSRFEIGLTELQSLFARAEDLALDQASAPSPGNVVELVRVSVATVGRGETRQLIHVRKKDAGRLRDARVAIRKVLKERFDGKPDFWLATLGQLLQEILSPDSAATTAASTDPSKESMS